MINLVIFSLLSYWLKYIKRYFFSKFCFLINFLEQKFSKFGIDDRDNNNISNNNNNNNNSNNNNDVYDKAETSNFNVFYRHLVLRSNRQ